MSNHIFKGKWITDKKMSGLKPINMYHKYITDTVVEPSKYENQHILFRRKFFIDNPFSKASIYITADDYYKLYINGQFVAQGPTPAYPFCYNYNTIDVTDYLSEGENVIAVHTLYQGLVNRVWVSGDNQHGLLLDLDIDDKPFLCSDDSFIQKEHLGYQKTEWTGYFTQFLENYDSNSSEVGFEKIDFDDSDWEKASYRQYTDYKLVPQSTKQLVFERILPTTAEEKDDKLLLDFGACYVGYLDVLCEGENGSKITVRCGQELDDNGSVRYELRCNCKYEEVWILSGAKDRLDWYDYKSFRYAELVLPQNCKVLDIALISRHYPFRLSNTIKPEYKGNEQIRKIWDLCVNTLKYGIQEEIHDCMEREKGFYIGDGYYTSITHMLLTGDDSMVRYIIDSTKKTISFNQTTVCCLNCSFMQEIAEYPLIIVALMLWHYRLTNDREYLKENFDFACKLLDSFSADYEVDYALYNLDKWSVIEWPKNFRDNYSIDVSPEEVCKQTHNVINAYFIESISNANKIAKILGMDDYRDVSSLKQKYMELFYDEKRKMFKDDAETEHSSYISNIFAYSFGLCPNEESENVIKNIIIEKGLSSVSFFAGFVLLEGMVRHKEWKMLKDMLLEKGTWSRMLSEGATTTFEGWGKDAKWNTSLFHLTMSYGALFICDVDLKKMFE